MQHRVLSAITAAAAAVCCIIPAVSMAEEAEPSGIGQSAEEVVSDISDGTGISKTSIYDEYREWSQLDPRFGPTPMNGTTIRSSGCLITSLAIMAVHSGSIDEAAMANLGITDIEEFNPSVLADAYTNVGGFSYGGAIASWGTINRLIPNIQFGWDRYLNDTSYDGAAAELRDLMDEGWHIIARVNNGGYHWVYIEGVIEDGGIVMCDPAKDTHDLYEGYPNGLQGEYWALKGSEAPHLTSAYEAGEYFLNAETPSAVLSDPVSGSAVTVLNKGNVVNITEFDGGYGLISSGEITGWVDMTVLSPSKAEEHILGDINGDGAVDKYDLALLNKYIGQLTELPDGISTLCSAELAAADINGDGAVDITDSVELLAIIRQQ